MMQSHRLRAEWCTAAVTLRFPRYTGGASTLSSRQPALLPQPEMSTPRQTTDESACEPALQSCKAARRTGSSPSGYNEAAQYSNGSGAGVMGALSAYKSRAMGGIPEGAWQRHAACLVLPLGADTMQETPCMQHYKMQVTVCDAPTDMPCSFGCIFRRHHLTSPPYAHTAHRQSLKLDLAEPVRRSKLPAARSRVLVPSRCSARWHIDLRAEGVRMEASPWATRTPAPHCVN
jgi:hypothetical protein